jgi:membrane protease YdiL (CAAX protease family)
MKMLSNRNRAPGALSFIVLTVALSWPLWIITWLLAGRPATISASTPMLVAVYAGSFGPGAAAAILYAITGRDALMAWLRSFVRFRCGWRAYAAALLPIPLATLLLTLLLGYSPRLDQAHGLPTIAFYLTLFPVSLFDGVLTALTGAGPLGEEGGWRGYLLPRLLKRGSETRASLIIGVVWALWHLPIMALFADWRSGISLAAYLPLYTVCVIALSFLFTRIWRVGGGSLIPCIWLHGIFNLVGGMAFDHRVWSSVWSTEVSVAHIAVAVWIAAGIVLFLTRRTVIPAHQEETQHLLRNPRNAERLLEAVTALDHGEGTGHELIG